MTVFYMQSEEPRADMMQVNNITKIEFHIEYVLLAQKFSFVNIDGYLENDIRYFKVPHKCMVMIRENEDE